jgi:hypothetical protein
MIKQLLFLPNGSILPLTVTLSIYLKWFLDNFDIILQSYPDISIGTPNYFVAASSLDAMFTFGER